MKKKGKHSNIPSGEPDYDEKIKWFEGVTADPSTFQPVTEQILIELKDEAKKCYDSETANYNIKNSKTNSNYQWMKTVISKGTISDKIAAHTVAIQDNALYNLEAIQSLINLVKVGKKKECLSVIDTLTELFISDLLRPNERLKSFHQRPLSLINELSSGNAVSRRKILSQWHFEDQLKELYSGFVFALNGVAHDVLDTNKEKAVAAMVKLLNANPEQEKNLLKNIVNKLGDPSAKVASKTIYNLSQILFKHPNMQGVVLTEVEKLIFRVNVSPKTQYYSLCFLSQFYLSAEDVEIAKRLIEVYFSFFKACVKKGEVNSRMMSALLMGVNRAFPYAKLQLEKITDHVDTMYRIVHVAGFNISLHALSLLYQVADHSDVTDRFYSALYKKLLDPNLLTTTHQAMVLSLVYKALLKDTEKARVKVFVKRLLQIASFTQPAFSCGILYLISQLIGKRPQIQAVVLQDVSIFADEENDDEEKYNDVPILDESVKEENAEDVKPDKVELDKNILKASWYHTDNVRKEKISYDPYSRNPLYAGGDKSTYTELINLKSHYHPTVALYAENILNGVLIKYSGDPLKDFTLIRFLDRFVYKNPKKAEDVVKGAHPTFGKRKLYVPTGLRSFPVNSAGFLNARNIPVDEVFLYNYLLKKREEKQTEDDDDSDLDSVKSEEFEEMLDKLGGGLRDDADDDLDYLNDIGDNLKAKPKAKKSKKRQDDDDDEEDSGDDEEEMSDFSEHSDDDMEMNDDDKSLLEDLDDDDDDDEEMLFDDEPEDKGSKRKKKSEANLFASAEEFASLLDDEGSSKFAPGGSNAYSNKDKAGVKQIAWEDKRNRWLHSYDKAIGKKGKNRNKPMQKKSKKSKLK